MRRKPGPALRWGAMCGGAAAVLVVIHALLASLVLDHTIAMNILSSVGFFLLYLVLFFMAGALAARETGSVRSGTLAGLFAGACSGGVSALAGIFDLSHQPLQDAPPPGSSIPTGHYYAVLALITIIVALIVLLVFVGFGAGFGALGGVAGRPDMPWIPPTATTASAPVPASIPAPGPAPSPATATANRDILDMPTVERE